MMVVRSWWAGFWVGALVVGVFPAAAVTPEECRRPIRDWVAEGGTWVGLKELVDGCTRLGDRGRRESAEDVEWGADFDDQFVHAWIYARQEPEVCEHWIWSTEEGLRLACVMAYVEGSWRGESVWWRGWSHFLGDRPCRAATRLGRWAWLEALVGLDRRSKDPSVVAAVAWLGLTAVVEAGRIVPEDLRSIPRRDADAVLRLLWEGADLEERLDMSSCIEERRDRDFLERQCRQLAEVYRELCLARVVEEQTRKLAGRLGFPECRRIVRMGNAEWSNRAAALCRMAVGVKVETTARPMDD